MHGRPRKPLKEEDESVLSAKAEKLRLLQSQFLANHQNRMYVVSFFLSSLSLSFFFFFFSFGFNLDKSGCRYSKEALDLSAKLLENNPECYTAWNYRKLAVQHNLSQSDSDSVASLFDQELKLVRILFTFK
jgi:geranylgeranyl transferase type-2 subunit alpha